MSTDNFSLTTKFRQKIIRTTWNVEKFSVLCEALNKSEITYPYFDSPEFGVGADGPQFFLRLYTKGDFNYKSNGYFSLYLKLKCAGNDQRWKMVENNCSWVRVKYDFVLLDTKDQEYAKWGL